jgi:ribosomal protein L37AE/L43A
MYDAGKKAEMSVLMAMAVEAEEKGNKERATELIEKAAALEMPKKTVRAASARVKKALSTVTEKVAGRSRAKSIKVSKPRKAAKASSSSGRSFAGRESTGMWACETCMSKGKIVTFKSKAAVEAHESSHKGGADFAALTVGAHPRMTRKCKWCQRRHSKGQCSSHGPGSFEATHPGQFPENEDED